MAETPRDPPPAAGGRPSQADATGFTARIADQLASGSAATIGGLSGSAGALVVAEIVRLDPGRPLLWVLPRASQAEAAEADLAYFLNAPPRASQAPALPADFPPVCQFPPLGELPTAVNPIPAETVGQRLAFLSRALEAGRADTPFVGVVPVGAFAQRLQPPAAVTGHQVELRVGEVLAPEALVETLLDAGFARVPLVELPGDLSLRGGIVDVFPFGAPAPWRLEFFGDELESLRAFDPATQRSYQRVARITLFTGGDPAVLDEPTGRPARGAKTATLVSYLPEGLRLIVSEPAEFDAPYALIAHSWPHRPPWRDANALWDLLRKRFRPLRLVGFVGSQGALDLGGEDAGGFAGTLGEVAGQLGRLAERAHEVRVLCRTAADQRRLHEVLDAQGLATAIVRAPVATPDDATATTSPAAPAGGVPPNRATAPAPAGITLQLGDIEAGFVLPAADVAVVLHTELLCKSRLRRAAPAAQASVPVTDVLELSEGDLVVHVTHGIARFAGLEHLTRDGVTGDFLVLEFARGARLFVPAVNVALVQKYVGAGGFIPEPNVLGGRRFAATKARVEHAVLQMAGDLLDLEAERRSRPGIAYPPDGPEQYEFESAFPFVETPDQLRVAREIAADMHAPRPMDRLVCGDVGFGKTELALRAAFRAVTAGRQVAVLVPTTVLAAQHAETFETRFMNVPIRVAALSRLCTGAQQREILTGLAEGWVDIVIGTHRLISRDVSFKNLGLVVIDEEQRFGVAAKERLKRVRATVDVLTLTATPIPRTLHLALLGIRPISAIATPPAERLAVHTAIAQWDASLIRDTLLRELSRDGQAYYVHNRVYDIEAVAARLRRLVPEARIGVGHGQLPERELERTMASFAAHEIDVLVCTTIIESGIDLPNVNTLIVERADCFGLANLHQLRGRVGRYTRRANAVFLLSDRTPSEIARRRLRAIAELAHLGSGFQIAMRDLEIRGAGNILGVEQSGHIAAVGYHLYCALLAAAVARLTGSEPTAEVAPAAQDLNLELGTDLYLPDDYIPDRRQRLQAYRKLFAAPTESAREAVVAELTDRYGPPPPEVQWLLRAARLRALASDAGVTNIRYQAGEGLHLTFTDFARLQPRLAALSDRVAVLEAHRLIIRTRPSEETPEQILELAMRALQMPKAGRTVGATGARARVADAPNTPAALATQGRPVQERPAGSAGNEPRS